MFTGGEQYDTICLKPYVTETGGSSDYKCSLMVLFLVFSH